MSEVGAPGILGLRAAGTRAILVELAGMQQVLALQGLLQEDPLPGQIDVLAAARTVLVTADSTSSLQRMTQVLRDADLSHSAEHDDTLIEIETVYDGADLADVAELTGLSTDGVVEAHTGQTWTAAFGGFAPGFAYLVGENQKLSVPRRKSPRTSVPAGSVALAGDYSAIYPRQSPGGWQLIGHTAAQMWDLDRSSPALVAPGNRVQYKSVRELIQPRDTKSHEPAAPCEGDAGVMVLAAGAQSLIQDMGRYGYADLGVSEAGALDRGAMRSANRLAGNAEDAAVIEVAYGGLTLKATADQVLAVAGAPVGLQITETGGKVRGAEMAAPFALLEGEKLTLGLPDRQVRSYIALRGGIDVPEVLGSRSSDTMSGIGPKPLAPKSFIPVAAAPAGSIVGTPEPQPELQPGESADQATRLDIVLGPRADWFDRSALDSLCRQEWIVSAESNRIGLRLEGDALDRVEKGELPSEGTLAGSIQMPPSGLPVLFLADHPVTGGYPVIGVVADYDLDRAAQVATGGRIRFESIPGPTTAQPLAARDGADGPAANTSES